MVTTLRMGPAKADGAPGSGLVSISDGNVPSRTDVTYDGAARPTITAVRSGVGSGSWHTVTTKTTYNGDQTTVVPPAGGTPQATITDGRGHIKTLRQYTTSAGISGAFQDTAYVYRPDGLLTKMTDPANNVWTRSYDLRGQLTASTDPDAGAVQHTYNSLGQIVTSKDARNNVLAYVYDSLGRKIEEHSASSTGPLLASWTYDTVAKGQLTSSTRYDSAGHAYIQAVTGYDDLYHATGTSLTIPNNETGLAGTYTTKASFNLDGQLKTYVQPTTIGGKAIGYSIAYNSLGMPAQMTAGTNGIINDTTYSAYGEAGLVTTGEALANVYIANTYEEGTRRLTNRQVTRDHGTGFVANTSYTYDDAGKLTSVSDKPTDVGAGSGNDTQCFSYDSLQHLTRAWTPGNGACNQTPAANLLGGPSPYWNDWTYNPKNGNRLTQTSHNTTGSTTTTNYNYPADGAVRPHALSSTTAGATTTSLGYDAAGNTQTRNVTGKAGTTYTWDEENRLSASTGPTGATSNLYDADGGLLITRDPLGKTLYVDDGTEIHYNTATSTQSLLHHYSWLGQTSAVDDGTHVTFLIDDPHGTGEIAIDDTNTVTAIRRLDPYGNPRGVAPPWPTTRGFVDGQANTTTGLTLLGAREYDPSLGRFLSVDPILDLGDPAQWNAYAYANSSPTWLTDPNGTDACYTVTCASPEDARREAGAAPIVVVHTNDQHLGLLHHGSNYVPVIVPHRRYEAPPAPKPCTNWLCSAGHSIHTAAKATMHAAIRHADLVGTIAGVVVGVSCTLVTGPEGAVLCGALGGFVTGVVTGYLKCQGGDASHCGAGNALKVAAIGTASGAAGGAAGNVLGAMASEGFSATVPAIGKLGSDTAESIRFIGRPGLTGARSYLSRIPSDLRKDAQYMGGRGPQLRDIGRNIWEGSTSREGIAAGAASALLPQTREGWSGLKNGPSFGSSEGANMIGGMLGGVFGP